MATKSFEELTSAEAKRVLNEFLEDGVANIGIVIAHANNAGIRCDYSIESLSQFLRWAFSEMKTFPKDPDMTVPEFIRSTESYQSGLFEFDDNSKNLICFAAYYLGECFVRSYPQLRWTTGNTEYHQANMPVVTGFKYDKELPPVLVIENAFRRRIRKPSASADIDVMIESWKKNVP